MARFGHFLVRLGWSLALFFFGGAVLFSASAKKGEEPADWVAYAIVASIILAIVGHALRAAYRDKT